MLLIVKLYFKIGISEMEMNIELKLAINTHIYEAQK